MPTLLVTQPDGEPLNLNAETGDNIMEPLRDAGLIDATCGGAASCGTCHVYFAKPELAGERTEDEGYMLESLADFVDVQDGSRLACQVVMTDILDGAIIEIAPEA